MTLTATNRGTGGNNTGATSIACVPQSNFAANSFGILVLAYDNTASGGADPFSSISDTMGNTWSTAINALYDPGASAAGTALRIFYSPMATGKLTTGHAVNVNFGSNSPVAKAFAFKELTGSVSNDIRFVSGGAGTGAGTGTPTVTATGVPSGYAIVGGGAAESADTWAGDADTTNGSWSTKQSTSFGSGTSGMSVIEQTKVVTATGDQVFNPTLTSVDCILAWATFREVTTTLKDMLGVGIIPYLR